MTMTREVQGMFRSTGKAPISRMARAESDSGAGRALLAGLCAPSDSTRNFNDTEAPTNVLRSLLGMPMMSSKAFNDVARNHQAGFHNGWGQQGPPSRVESRDLRPPLQEGSCGLRPPMQDGSRCLHPSMQEGYRMGPSWNGSHSLPLGTMPGELCGVRPPVDGLHGTARPSWNGSHSVPLGVRLSEGSYHFQHPWHEGLCGSTGPPVWDGRGMPLGPPVWDGRVPLAPMLDGRSLGQPMLDGRSLGQPPLGTYLQPTMERVAYDAACVVEPTMCCVAYEFQPPFVEYRSMEPLRDGTTSGVSEAWEAPAHTGWEGAPSTHTLEEMLSAPHNQVVGRGRTKIDSLSTTSDALDVPTNVIRSLIGLPVVTPKVGSTKNTETPSTTTGESGGDENLFGVRLERHEMLTVFGQMQARRNAFADPSDININMWPIHQIKERRIVGHSSINHDYAATMSSPVNV